ncbi:S4 RNA-binding domain-containing protein [Citrus sinensis]|nr:S4 RNA-binding domain-containing protein [Citrus sinensis]
MEDLGAKIQASRGLHQGDPFSPLLFTLVVDLLDLVSIVGCESGDWPLKYLGLPLGGNPKAVEFWAPVLEKVEKRLDGWRKARPLVDLICRLEVMASTLLYLKRRLDEICLERFQPYSRTYLQSWILQGKVFVDGKVVNKAGTAVSDKAVVEIIAQVPKYVCRVGHKLEAAIEQLGVDVAGKVALDSGLSTGGFTDCLLQYGASFVYGVDVADKIRCDARVSVIERTNLRYLTALPQRVDLVTLDLSFISILTVMPAVINLMKEEATLITLVKPQFEARRSQVGGGRIVRDPLVHKEVLEKVIKGVENFGFQTKGWIESPLKGA